MTNREQLIRDYVDQVLDNMDMDTLLGIAEDVLLENLSAYTDEQLIEEVEDHYPELLEN